MEHILTGEEGGTLDTSFNLNFIKLQVFWFYIDSSDCLESCVKSSAK